MADRPIIFSGPMVRALLDGRKTQTRRLASSPLRCCVAGDCLYVREAWCPANSEHGPVLLTRADFGRRFLDDESWPVDYDRFPAGRGAWSAWAADVENGTTRDWRPSIHMPRWASRLTLIVEAVRVERLQAISEASARAEGLEHREDWLPQWRGAECLPWRSEFPRDAFADLWGSLHTKLGERWEDNPSVVALPFRVLPANIDQEKTAHVLG